MGTTVTIGLTGGIACGKSTVAAMLADLGAAVVDADAVAREVVAKGSDGLAEVVSAFGEGVLDAEGELDRKRLGELVFADETRRRELEAITHPRIRALSLQRIAEATASGAPYVIYEAALLVETGIHATFAALVVVSVDERTQLERLMARDGIDEPTARARIDAQMPLGQKRAVADWVIDNSGRLDQTRARTAEVHAALLQRFVGE